LSSTSLQRSQHDAVPLSMGRFRRFLAAMFSELGSGLSGPASVPFAVASLWVSSHLQRLIYGSLAGILFLFSAYRIWATQEEKTSNLELQLATLKKTHFDTRPQLGLELEGAKGPTAWQNAIGGDAACRFWLQQLGGRTATSIRFDPLLSKGGRFTLNFDAVPFVESSPRHTALRYYITEVGFPRLSAHDLEKTGDMEGTLLKSFLDDSPPELDKLEYTLTARFRDNGEELFRQFRAVFDRTRYMFLADTEQPCIA
jgi:hypothetical protein